MPYYKVILVLYQYNIKKYKRSKIMLVDKATFRNECKKKLQKSSKISKYYKDKMIEKHLNKIINIYNPKNILVYLPIGFEPKIVTFINILRKNYNIFVPFMEGVSFKIVKYRLPLFEKRFSIKEPNNSFFKFVRIDLAIVPVLGVGRDYKRVGFGKGMYDRFFATLKYKPIIVFVQIDKCFDKNVTTDKYDIQSDFYITPKKIYITRGNRYDSRDINRCSKYHSRRSFRSISSKKTGIFKI